MARYYVSMVFKNIADSEKPGFYGRKIFAETLCEIKLLIKKFKKERSKDKLISTRIYREIEPLLYSELELKR